MPLETTTGEDKPQAQEGAGTGKPSGSAGAANEGKDDAGAGAPTAKTSTTGAGTYLDQAFDQQTGGGEGAAPSAEPGAAHAAWPDQWREEVAAKYAGKTDRNGKPVGDRMLAQLKRYASPVDALLGGLAAQDKIRSGDYKSQLPEDASDEQKAEWRKANSIPDTPEGYDKPQLEGRQWSDEDQPVLSSFLAAAHEANLPQDTVNTLTEWYGRTVTAAKEAEEQARVQLDNTDKKTITDQYRQEWGPEYQAHLSLMGRAIHDPALFPGGLGTELAQARLADGHRLVNHPAFPRFLTNLALGHYGDGALISGDSKGAVHSREEELIKIRNTDIDRYYRERNASGQTLADELMEIRQKKTNPRGTRGA